MSIFNDDIFGIPLKYGFALSLSLFTWVWKFLVFYPVSLSHSLLDNIEKKWNHMIIYNCIMIQSIVC